jgi:maltodextrin utilization protein YvdJ
MEQFIWVVIPLIIAGLGFVTYRHPPEARRIINVGMCATLGFYLLLLVYYIGQSSSFLSSIKATGIIVYKHEKPVLPVTEIPKDRIDSLMTEQQKSIFESTYQYDMGKNERTAVDSIRNTISKAADKANEQYNSLLIGCIISMVTLFVFRLLSFVFEPLRQPNTTPQNNSPGQTP